MGRSPCCSKEGLNRGAWSAMEDRILTAYIRSHGEGKWRNLPKRADNEIKNYWNTTLGKKIGADQSTPDSSKQIPTTKLRGKKPAAHPKSSGEPPSSPPPPAIRPKALRCPKFSPQTTTPPSASLFTSPAVVEKSLLEFQAHQTQSEIPGPGVENSHGGSGAQSVRFSFDGPNGDFSPGNDLDLAMDQTAFKDWTACEFDLDQGNGTLDLDFLTSLLDSEEWP
ncbi:hypothetical protein U1Q18_036800 [Sarracenia purpurea var. burkii]